MIRYSKIATGLAVATIAFGQPQTDAPILPKGRIVLAVAAAKKEGRTEVSLPALGVMRTGVDSMEVVRDKYSVFLAEPVSTAVTATNNSITTWYTLAIDEVLLRQPADSLGKDYSELPALVPSPTSNQMLLPFGGGQVVVDGITIREEPAVGVLQLGKKYVFVLHLQRTTAIAELAAQADGIFELSSDGLSIRSLRPSSRLAQDVQRQWADQLDAVRGYLKSRTQ